MAVLVVVSHILRKGREHWGDMKLDRTLACVVLPDTVATIHHARCFQNGNPLACTS
jgi:hypothetical protein